MTEVRTRADPGIVDEHIEAPMRLLDAMHQRLDLIGVRDVYREGRRGAVRLDDLLRGLLGRFAIDIGDEDMRSFTREGLANGAADTGPSARDQCDFVLKPPHRIPLSVLAAPIFAAR